MKIGVTHKLFLAILAAAGLAVVSSALIMQWSLGRGFLKYVNSVEKTGLSRLAGKLEENYRNEQGWEKLRLNPQRWRQLVMASLPIEGPPPPDGVQDEPPPEPAGGVKERRHGLLPPHLARHFDQRLFLLDRDGKVLISQVEVPVGSEATPLRYQGQIAGYLGLLPRTKISDAPQQRFLKEQRLAFVLVAGVVVLLAAGLSLLLARRLVRPLRKLTEATHQLAAGGFSVRVTGGSNDELGQFANDFNALALALEKNEQARRQWVADISHELRTPLAILRGEIEALQDGIRQPTQDAIHSLHVETVRLGRLVDDLYQLSISDVGALTYRKDELDLAALLTETVAAHRPEFTAKGLMLEEELPKEAVADLFGDSERLRQLFGNLLDNALNYTDAGGRLLVSLQYDDGNAIIDFQDTAPGVSESEMGRLFERLYRVESSRSRASGGAGLGLAICRNIVEAHGGSISAHQSQFGGVWIRMILPLAGSSL